MICNYTYLVMIQTPLSSRANVTYHPHLFPFLDKYYFNFPSEFTHANVANNDLELTT